MDMESKRQYIITATGKFAGLKIHPRSRGRYVTRLLRGKPVGDALIEDMYKNVIDLEGGTAPTRQLPKVDKAIYQVDKVDKAVDKILEMERQNNILQRQLDNAKEENARLKAKVDKLSTLVDNKANSVLSTKVDKVDSEVDKLGFSLTLRKAGNSRKLYWYAGKRIAGKQVWVYIGKDKATAPVKVRKWMERNMMGKVDSG